MENFIRNSSLFFLSKIFPKPLNTLSCRCGVVSISDFAFVFNIDLTTLLSVLRSSFVSARLPSGLIYSMPRSISVILPSSGGEFILPFTTTNIVSVHLVSLRAVASNSPGVLTLNLQFFLGRA